MTFSSELHDIIAVLEIRRSQLTSNALHDIISVLEIQRSQLTSNDLLLRGGRVRRGLEIRRCP
eukprot:11158189-Lingulodinium_polyedra.AAC.1